ncbi:MAG: acyl-CoA dehydrogenase family protein, partial [Pseudomonadales bacterium]|nr:acyl-CoA dehydrogenase family protein [Pseudomonadales bacterium]
MNQELKAELALFRDNVKRFIDSEIIPNYERWEKSEIFPRDVWNKLGDQGFLAVDIPEEWGGFGSEYLFTTVLIEEFQKSNCASLGVAMTVHSDIVAHYVLNNGSDEQKQKYLPKMVTGECVGAIAMTEPGTGSDLQGIRTTAKMDGDEYVINGSKTFITNG